MLEVARARFDIMIGRGYRDDGTGVPASDHCECHIEREPGATRPWLAKHVARYASELGHGIGRVGRTDHGKRARCRREVIEPHERVLERRARAEQRTVLLRELPAEAPPDVVLKPSAFAAGECENPI